MVYVSHAPAQGSWGLVKWAAELLGIQSESSSEGDFGAEERLDKRRQSQVISVCEVPVDNEG